MKVKIPQGIVSFTTVIGNKRAEIIRLQADIERAGAAAKEARQLEDQLEALGERRARLKAQAFIDGKKADLEELDRQEAELEKASRRAREDGKAGALAAEMLQEKITGIEAEIAELQQDRKAAALAWLETEADSVMSTFIAALESLGPIQAQAIAIARAKKRISGDLREGVAEMFRSHSWDLPIPYSHQQDIPGRPGARRTPISWIQTKGNLGDGESESLFDSLRAAGVAP